MLMELAKLVYARTRLAVREERGSQSIEWVAIGVGAVIVLLVLASFMGKTADPQIGNAISSTVTNVSVDLQGWFSNVIGGL